MNTTEFLMATDLPQLINFLFETNFTVSLLKNSFGVRNDGDEMAFSSFYKKSLSTGSGLIFFSQRPLNCDIMDSKTFSFIIQIAGMKEACQPPTGLQT